MELGIVQIPEEQYFADPGMNSGALAEILRSPRHYWIKYVKKKKFKESPALRKGRLFHLSILQPWEALDRFVISPKFDRRTTKGKEEEKDFLANLKPSALVLSEDEYEQFGSMAENVLANKFLCNLLKDGVREHSMFWDRDGLRCKGKVDFMTKDGIVADLKTTRNAAPIPFSKSVVNYNNDLQAAWYLDGLSRITGSRKKSFIWIAVENETPYEIGIHVASPSMIQLGEEKYEKALRAYNECVAKNDWPGYSKSAVTLEPPSWAVSQIMEEIEYDGN